MALKQKHLLWGLLIIGIIVRVAYLFTLDPMFQYRNGGDSGFYLQIGRDLLGTVDYTNILIPVAPLYLLIVGIPQHIFSPSAAIIFIWIIQLFANIAICYFAYRIATNLTEDWRVGFVSASALIFSISFTIELGNVLTETAYIFFIMLGLWLYIEHFLVEEYSTLRRNLLIAHIGISFGLAILTRPVLLLFPFGIMIHMLMVRQWSYVPTFLALCAFVTLSWTAYTSLYYNWTVIGSNQFMPTIWRGALEETGSPRENDEMRGDLTYAEQTGNIITSNPLGYLQRRISQLLDAYLQPHGTIPFGSQSLKSMTLEWLKNIFSVQAFGELISGEGFLPKLLIYIWHYTSLIAGLVGMWLTRRNWQISLILIGFIAYTTLVHMISLALPRYIFPTYPIWWIFAAVSIVKLWDIVRARIAQSEE